jgi:hypothetical protein
MRLMNSFKPNILADFAVIASIWLKNDVSMYRRYPSRLEGCRYEISAILCHLGWIDAPHIQNFEISKANSGVNKFENPF